MVITPFRALYKRYVIYLYRSESGKSTPHEILDAISFFNAEGRPIWNLSDTQLSYGNQTLKTGKMEQIYV